jgi:hypothetical protein
VDLAVEIGKREVSNGRHVYVAARIGREARHLIRKKSIEISERFANFLEWHNDWLVH